MTPRQRTWLKEGSSQRVLIICFLYTDYSKFIIFSFIMAVSFPWPASSHQSNSSLQTYLGRSTQTGSSRLPLPLLSKIVPLDASPMEHRCRPGRAPTTFSLPPTAPFDAPSTQRPPLWPPPSLPRLCRRTKTATTAAIGSSRPMATTTTTG